MGSQLDIHLLHQLEQIAKHLQHVHPFGSQPGLRRDHPLADRGNTFAQALDQLLHIPTYRGVMLLPHHQVQIPPGRLVQIIHRRQARRSTRQQLKRTQRLDLLDTAHRFS